MDVAKAKNILIFVFLALNIFLLVNIGIYKYGQNVSNETILKTRDILDKKGVKLECEIPSYLEGTPALVYEKESVDIIKMVHGLLRNMDISADSIILGKEFISGSKKILLKDSNTLVFSDEMPGDKVNLNNIKAVERYARTFLKDNNIDIHLYKLDSYSKGSDSKVSLLFTEKYDKYLVFDNYLKATVTDKGIEYIEWKQKKIRGLSAEVAPVMAAHEVLLKNLAKENNFVITGMDIGFKGFMPEEEAHNAPAKIIHEGPVWRIKIKDGRYRYFKASNGEEIK